MRSSFQAAISRRFVLLCDTLLPEGHGYRDGSRESLSVFLLDETLTTELRAFIGWFSVRATSPNEDELSQLMVILGTKNPDLTLRWLYFHGYTIGRTAQLRQIHVTSKPVYDCTNVFSASSIQTGIPRVSRQFLVENMDLHSQCFVWSDGVMGPIEFDPQKGFSKKKAIWPNSGGFLDFSRITHSVTAWIARRTTSFQSRTLYYLVLSLGLFANWLLVSVFRFRGPGPTVAILPLGDIWSFETVSADTASRYLGQIRSVPSTRVSMMLYDFLPIHLPNNFLPIVVENFVHQLRLMDRCKTLLTDSLHLLPPVTAAIQMMEGTSVPKICARPLHITSKWLTSNVSRAPDELRFLQIGALETRKNHHLTLAAFSQLSITPRRLSLVGREVKPAKLITELIEQVKKTDGIVEFHHGLTDEQIIELSRSTTAMVYPSIAEGYGLPILEGLAMGLPVIASDIAPHRQFSELGGIVYFDPTSVTSLKLAMEFVADPENNWNLRSSIRFERIPADPTAWARETRLVLEA